MCGSENKQRLFPYTALTEEVKKDRKCCACGTFGGEGKGVQAFCWGHLIERDHLEDLAIEVRLILRSDIKETELKSVDWINVAQDRDSRQAVVNMVMNLCRIKCGQFVDYLRNY